MKALVYTLKIWLTGLILPAAIINIFAFVFLKPDPMFPTFSDHLFIIAMEIFVGGLFSLMSALLLFISVLMLSYTRLSTVTIKSILSVLVTVYTCLAFLMFSGYKLITSTFSNFYYIGFYVIFMIAGVWYYNFKRKEKLQPIASGISSVE